VGGGDDEGGLGPENRSVPIANQDEQRSTRRIGAAELGLSEVDLEKIDCIIARSIAPREIEP
jgi:hypothetical protein